MRYRKILIKPTDGFFKDINEIKPSTGNNYRINILLFLATLLSTTLVGAIMDGVNPFAGFQYLAKGLPFSVTLLSILGIHEFGHYFAARRWGMNVTLPYFIPAPILPIGTFGAVIKMKSSIPNRKALIDVGAAGPIAGFIVAVVASIIGLKLSEIVPSGGEEHVGALILGESLVFKFLVSVVIGNLPENAELYLHPVAFAGWIGIFVTALNLIPIGQLDGGHILFSLSPRVHEMLRRIRLPLLLLMGLTFWNGWYVWALILLFIGRSHPYPDHMDYRIGTFRKIIAIAAIIIFIISFTPIPVQVMG